MKIRILAFGTRMPDWVETGSNEYFKRLPKAYAPEIVQLAPAKRTSGKSVAQLIDEEDERMLAQLKSNERVIALDKEGSAWTTEQLAVNLGKWQQEATDVCLIIGGPDGLGPKCLAKAKQKWSLSKLTFPHPLIRVLLAEQLYRAWSIQQGHPYHK